MGVFFPLDRKPCHSRVKKKLFFFFLFLQHIIQLCFGSSFQQAEKKYLDFKSSLGQIGQKVTRGVKKPHFFQQ